MAEILKNLGQLLPSAHTLTSIYIVPAARSAAISSVVACNQSSFMARFRISHAVSGASNDPAQYLYYDELIPPNKTFIATLGITLAATDVLRVLSDNGLISFNVYGSELT